MIAGLQPYPTMKDSGVEWLGEVPTHWEMRRLKSWLGNIVEQADELPQVNTVVALENVESWTGRVALADSGLMFDSQLKRFRSGDVLFGKLRPYLAKVARLTSSGLCVGEFLVLRPRHGNVMGPYFEYLLRSKPIIDAVTASTYGAKMPRADWGFIGGMPVVRPPLAEQAAIVRFLDYIDRRIQGYIRAKEKLIALLEEQKQAVIHQAVTGQFDVRTDRPYPAYKPSRVKWLGQVPVHWEVQRLRYLIKGKLTYGANASAEHTNPKWPRYLRITDFSKDGRLRRDTFRSLPPEIAKDYLVKPGDVLLARSGATVGKAFFVDEDEVTGTSCHAGYLIRARLNHSLLSGAFFFLFTQSAAFARWKDVTLITATIPNIGADKYADLPVPVPPTSEQEEILEFFSSSVATIKRAVQRATVKIARLHEYRTRLIADVVTGKLDVREAAAGLPEVDPLAAEGDSVDVVDHEIGSERRGWRHTVEEGSSSAVVADAERSETGQSVRFQTFPESPKPNKRCNRTK